MTRADMVCSICGSVIGDIPTHSRWHKVSQLHVLVDEGVQE